MKFHSVFSETHKRDHKVDENTVELRFMRHICEGKSNVEEFFNEKTINGRTVKLYTPGEKYEGIEEIRKFARGFLKSVDAKSATVHPVMQTIAGGRSVSEVEIWFETGEDEPYKVPMGIFGDLSNHGKLEGVRIYYFYQWVKGTPAYHKPIYRPKHNEVDDSTNLTGVVKYYYEQLHNANVPVALENIVNLMSDNLRFGGYRPVEVNPPLLDKALFKEKYVHTLDKIPCHQYILFNTITDDGKTAMIEWTSVVRKDGLALGYVSQAGMVAYERDPEDSSKLVSIRICDNWGWEKEIDYSTVYPEDQFID